MDSTQSADGTGQCHCDLALRFSSPAGSFAVIGSDSGPALNF